MKSDDNWAPVGPSVVFNAPPNWPPPPQGWLPAPDWEAPKSWGPVPEGWDLFLELPAGQTSHSGIPGVRSIAPRYADKGYGVVLAEKKRRTPPRQIFRSLIPKVWGSRRRRILSIGASGFILIFLISQLSSPAQENPSAVARKFCPPAVTTEIAERLEVAEEKVSGKPPTAGSYSPYVPPRGGVPGMMSARTAQTTILRSSTTQGMVMAEGNFRAVDKTYWQFSCTIDVAAEEPVVTRVVVSPMGSSAQNPYAEGSGVTG